MTTFERKSFQATEAESRVSHVVKIKRVYERRDPGDGTRILVDRLWPRGLTKERAGVDLWLKEVAPSTRLRKWFGHDPKKWKDFRSRYRTELKKYPDELATIRERAKKERVTLLYGARDQEHNEAIALKELLEAVL